MQYFGWTEYFAWSESHVCRPRLHECIRITTEFAVGGTQPQFIFAEWVLV